MTYDHWKTRSDRDDRPDEGDHPWAARNQPIAYDDNHWRELISTVVDRIGADNFWSLALDVLKDKTEPAGQMFVEFKRGGGDCFPLEEKK